MSPQDKIFMLWDSYGKENIALVGCWKTGFNAYLRMLKKSLKLLLCHFNNIISRLHYNNMLRLTEPLQPCPQTWRYSHRAACTGWNCLCPFLPLRRLYTAAVYNSATRGRNVAGIAVAGCSCLAVTAIPKHPVNPWNIIPGTSTGKFGCRTVGFAGRINQQSQSHCQRSLSGSNTGNTAPL